MVAAMIAAFAIWPSASVLAQEIDAAEGGPGHLVLDPPYICGTLYADTPSNAACTGRQLAKAQQLLKAIGDSYAAQLAVEDRDLANLGITAADRIALLRRNEAAFQHYSEDTRDFMSGTLPPGSGVAIDATNVEIGLMIERARFLFRECAGDAKALPGTIDLAITDWCPPGP